MKKVIAVLILLCVTVFAQQKDAFTDKRDGKTYRTVKIGSQVWMAENLNYDASGSVCYDNDPKNCEKYGRLYDWNAAMEACPDGWHLPSDAKWAALGNEVGYLAGEQLKAKSGWNNNGNGTDAYGFAALPGGYSGGSFSNVGNDGLWWSATEFRSNYAYSWYMSYYYENVGQNNYGKAALLSVRCVKDPAP